MMSLLRGIEGIGTWMLRHTVFSGTGNLDKVETRHTMSDLNPVAPNRANPPSGDEDSRTVDMHTAQKSNKKEVSHYLTGETFVRKAKTEGATYQSEKRDTSTWPPSLLEAMKCCSNLQLKIERRI